MTAKSVTVDSSGKYATHAYSGCAGGATVQLLEMYDVGHTPYENVDTDVDTTSLVKEFMFQFERQELQLSSSPSNEPTSQVTTSASPQLQSADESLLQGSIGKIIKTKFVFVTIFVITYVFSFI